jgi:hypothetical protein
VPSVPARRSLPIDEATQRSLTPDVPHGRRPVFNACDPDQDAARPGCRSPWAPPLSPTQVRGYALITSRSRTLAGQSLRAGLREGADATAATGLLLGGGAPTRRLVQRGTYVRRGLVNRGDSHRFRRVRRTGLQRHKCAGPHRTDDPHLMSSSGRQVLGRILGGSSNSPMAVSPMDIMNSESSLSRRYSLSVQLPADRAPWPPECD